ncbi:hypothetical protein KY289_031613 [Solanum tuberosum]|nr:hypothetical protein KY289_031613 [Solanum tuberosum]
MAGSSAICISPRSNERKRQGQRSLVVVRWSRNLVWSCSRRSCCNYVVCSMWCSPVVAIWWCELGAPGDLQKWKKNREKGKGEGVHFWWCWVFSVENSRGWFGVKRVAVCCYFVAVKREEEETARVFWWCEVLLFVMGSDGILVAIGGGVVAMRAHRKRE